MSRPVTASCSRCGARTPAKRLTRLPFGFVCQKCLDKIHAPERRSLLRKVQRP